MPIARITATYSENSHDTITLLCAVDNERQICHGEWFGVVKNDDGKGDKSNYPFTLHIDYLNNHFYIDYGSDDTQSNFLQRTDIHGITLAEKARFSIFDEEEDEEYQYQITSTHIYE